MVALADVYNALTSERCYKKAFDHDTAIAMILGGECGAFNPLLLECLADVSPRLRITSHVPLDGDPYRLEVNRLSDELLARADLPRNDRVQRILESLQERIDFFASCSGGIQFEFDALSGLADITNWDEPPPVPPYSEERCSPGVLPPPESEGFPPAAGGDGCHDQGDAGIFREPAAALRHGASLVRSAGADAVVRPAARSTMWVPWVNWWTRSSPSKSRCCCRPQT